MSSQSLIHASQMTPIIRGFDAMGVSPEVHLRALSLPRHGDSDPTLFVSEPRVWSLFDRGRTATGVEDFGFRVAANSSLFDLGLLGQKMAAAVSLQEVINLLIESVNSYSTDAEFSLQSVGTTVLFCRHGMAIEEGAWPVEQYTLWTMLELCRMALGPEWLPDTFWLKHDEPLEHEEHAWLGGKRVYQGSTFTAFSIPQNQLSCRVLPVITRIHGVTWALRQVVTRIQMAIEECMDSDEYSIGAVAEVLGSSPRSIQRQLAPTGWSFRELMSKARFVRAKYLLRYSETQVTRIAFKLGYADLPSFSRAFHHWAGISPTIYRNQYRSAEAPAGDRTAIN